MNSIDRTTPTNISSSASLNTTIRRDSLKGDELGETLRGNSFGRLKTATEVRRKSSTGLMSSLLSSGSAGTGAGTGVSTVMSSSPTDIKKKREKSASLPQLFKSQKELDYLEYLTSSSRLGQQAIQAQCESYCFKRVSDYIAIQLRSNQDN